MQALLALGRFFLPSLNLCGEGKGVDQEKPSEFFELLDLFARKLFVIMRALIAVKANEVRPLFKVRRQPAVVCEKINALGQWLPCGGGIKFSSGHIDGFAEHGSGSIGITSFGVIKALDEWAPYRGRNVIGGIERLFDRVCISDYDVGVLRSLIEVSCAARHNPLHAVTGSNRAHTEDFIASVAGKHRGALVLTSGNDSDRSHGDRRRFAMRAMSNKCDGHIQSMVAQERALRWES